MHLERVTNILEFVSQRDVANVAEICASLNLPKPTVYRLVHNLVSVGLLEPAARGSFRIGARLKQMTQIDQSDQALRDLIAPTLKESAIEHGCAFFLSRLRGRAVEIIHVETPNSGVSYLHPGLGKRPLHACSCAKVIAAFSPELLKPEDMEGRLRAYTEYTLTRVEDLHQELATIRDRGFAECVEELERGICSVAAPLAASGPGAAMSVGATGSLRLFTPAFREMLGHQITAIAAEIASRLDWGEAATSTTAQVS
ncbi:MAG: IclR family transcriptional regulator C-terminal domain-containing protein [Spiribacter sp.]|nr:IclR family transcriptional regulator C-terminal domain-containing protein [Spiribacter sp.]